MKNILVILVIAGGSFFAGETYERIRQQPIIAERVAEARRTVATPPPPTRAWMYAADRHTPLDEPAKTVGPRYHQ